MHDVGVSLKCSIKYTLNIREGTLTDNVPFVSPSLRPLKLKSTSNTSKVTVLRKKMKRPLPTDSDSNKNIQLKYSSRDDSD